MIRISLKDPTGRTIAEKRVARMRAPDEHSVMNDIRWTFRATGVGDITKFHIDCPEWRAHGEAPVTFKDVRPGDKLIFEAGDFYVAMDEAEQ